MHLVWSFILVLCDVGPIWSPMLLPRKSCSCLTTYPHEKHAVAHRKVQEKEEARSRPSRAKTALSAFEALSDPRFGDLRVLHSGIRYSYFSMHDDCDEYHAASGEETEVTDPHTDPHGGSGSMRVSLFAHLVEGHQDRWH